MINENNNNIQSNSTLLTPEEMKQNLEKINKSFSNYMNSLIKDFDQNPENLKDSVKYSTELIDEFKSFYDKFNILSDEVLSNKIYPNQQQNNNINSNERKKIVIDNMAVKELDQIIRNDIDKLEEKTKENNDKIKKFNEEIYNLFNKNKKK